MSIRRLAILIGLIAGHFTAAALRAQDAPPWPEWRAPIVTKFAADLKKLDGEIAQRPESVPLRSFRGDCRLFLGDSAGAVADFEKMMTLDPEQDAPHWRLGIAYYFAGQFEKSARQFEKYHAYDGRDRENGIWQFLAQSKVVGVEKARGTMLEYAQFDREPFPALYEMFAGRKTPDAVLATVELASPPADPQVLFFARYYAGLAEEQAGRREQAIDLLGKAVAMPEARAPDGPGYMWQVARLAWERLLAKAPK